MKWRLAFGVFCDQCILIRLKEKVLYDLWSRMLANQEAKQAQNEYTRDENVKMDVQ